MSTLAQDYLLYGKPDLSGNGNKVLRQWTHDLIISRLRAPLIGSEPEAKLSAERYVFDDTPPAIIAGLIKAGAIPSSVVIETARLPAQNIWIEFPYPEVGTKIGLLVATVNDSIIKSRTVLAMAAVFDDNIQSIGLSTIPKLPFADGKSELMYHWFLGHDAGEDHPDANHDVRVLFYDLIDCLFLINTPRVSEFRTGAFGKRKIKADDTTTLPLIEYKRITLKVGVGSPRYLRAEQQPDPSSPSFGHRKLHQATGHFRTYRKGREQPHVAYVPEHWRGDAALGIILHERVVKT